MNKKIFSLFTLSGILLWLGWCPLPTAALLFIAFIPMLYALELCKGKKNSIAWAGIYWTLLIWNIGTTWWVWNASAGGAAAAIVLNALLQSFPILLFYVLQTKLPQKLKWFALPIFFIAFEKIHLTWEFTWPWLTLGNGFASFPQWVQWYEFTGHLGGSAWIWLYNISLYLAIFQNQNKPFFSRWIQPFAAVAIPLLFSFIILFTNQRNEAAIKRETKNFVLIQPNIDPYNEKFNEGTEINQVNKILSLAEKNIDSIQSTILVAPETALPTGIWWHHFENDDQIIPLRKFLQQHKNVSIVIGSTILEEYDSPKTASASAFGKTGKYVDMFNTALLIDSTKFVQKYYKSKLVPGVERMPYPGFFKFLKPFLINMGGVSDNTGTQEERTVFNTNNFGLAPLICYESVYGSFVSKFVKNGANILLIITNDGWWGNTPGHLQHFEYARLRAIETRRYVLQCANTGISGVIDNEGNILQQTDYWKEAVVKVKAPLFYDKTFFVKFGDELEWAVVALLIFFIMIVILNSNLKFKT